MISVPYEVKKALRDGMLRKNYRFVVLNDDGTEDFTIDNDTLVSESVSIDERMCSGDTLKFGLCEGSSLDFQYFMLDKGQYEANKTYMRNNLVHSNGVTWRSRTDNNTGNPLVEGDYWAEWVKPNITGRRVQVFVDVEYEKVITEYVWETQASFNNYYTISGMSGDCRLYSSLSNAWNYVYVRENGVETQVYPTPSASGTIIELGDVTGRTLMVNLDVMPAPSAQLQLLIPHTRSQILTYSIPMGFFDVAKCSRQASTGIIKATCYNKLQSEYLDAKANADILNLFVDKDSSILLYDLKRLMLGEYQIEEAEVTDITEDHRGYSADIDDASTTKFRNLLGDFGPIGPCPFNYTTQASLSTAFNIFLSSGEWEWTLDPTKYYRIDSNLDLDALETSFFDYLEDLIACSDLTITYETYMDNLVKNGNYHGTSNKATWKHIFSILLTKNDDTEECYSVIAGRYGLSAVGTMGDLSKKTFTGYKKMQFWVPISIYRWWTSGQTEIISKVISFGGNDFTYDYWIYDNPLTSATGTWSAFVYPDGSRIADVIDPNDFMNLLQVEDLTDAEKISVNISTIPDYTLREIASANYETVCQFGQLSRITDLFSGVELNHSRLYPADSLYPATDLYPGGAALSGAKSMYSKLWADEGNVHKWRNLVITYKGLNADQQEEDFTLERQVNADGTDDYNMSDNWLFRNLVWTAEDVGDYADAMVAKMQDMTWFPFEMWCAGLPYLETGDEIEIPLNGESYTSYVLQRQLKGIQNLQDTYINGTLDIF